MAQLDQDLNQLIADIEVIKGAAVIDIESRQRVGSAGFPQALSEATLDALAVSVVEMMRGKSVSAAESLLSTCLAHPVSDEIQEMCINTRQYRIFLTEVKNNPEFILMMGTANSVNIGLGWVWLQRVNNAVAEVFA